MTLDAKQAARCDQLFKMGLMFNGSAYVGKDLLEDVNVPALDIQCLDDMQWERDMGRLQREIDRRNALPPLDIQNIWVNGGVFSNLAAHYGVAPEDLFAEISLGDYWRSRVFKAMEARKGTSFMIITADRNTAMVQRYLRLNSDDDALKDVKIFLVGVEQSFR